MSVNFNNLSGGQPGNQQIGSDKGSQVRQQTNQQATVQQTTKASAKDSVSLTPQAQQFNKLQQKASNSSGVDSSKVNDIKKAIAEGKYEVNIQRLAEKLASFESDLFN
ncbi:MAG: flagellar biosynthesis anti-sigma factor FlgM [Algicola sp.]|nr:flagellar biosynthesis anti-sigma factor FlgM [Algicola sp.]